MISGGSIRENVASIEEKSLPEIGFARNGLVHLGGDIWIENLLYKSHMRVTPDRSFITTICYELWGAETLARRVVREQKNVTFKALIPEKKSAAEELFNIWMIKKKLPDSWRSEHMSKVNTYLNGSITAARKKINLDIKEERVSENSDSESENHPVVNNNKKVTVIAPGQSIKKAHKSAIKASDSATKSLDPTITNTTKSVPRPTTYKSPKKYNFFRKTLLLTWNWTAL